MWIAGIAILIAIAIVAIIIFAVFSDAILAPKGYLFYEQEQFTGRFTVVVLILPAVLLWEFFAEKIGLFSTDKTEDDLIFIWSRLGVKGKIAAVIIWIICIYCCFTNVTYVMEDKIIARTPFNPVGTEYNYSDVEKIKTGFGNKKISFLDYKEEGEFSYIITLDGKDIVFSYPSVSGEIERYAEDTYLELEEFDKALMEYDIPKQASKKGYENCEFDDEYVERFLRIIESK